MPTFWKIARNEWKYEFPENANFFKKSVQSGRVNFFEKMMIGPNCVENWVDGVCVIFFRNSLFIPFSPQPGADVADFTAAEAKPHHILILGPPRALRRDLVHKIHISLRSMLIVVHFVHLLNQSAHSLWLSFVPQDNPRSFDTLFVCLSLRSRPTPLGRSYSMTLRGHVVLPNVPSLRSSFDLHQGDLSTSLRSGPPASTQSYS